ncbi:MAG TPA: hypothetical protein VMY78_18600, partial [Solirubrobacteraceae bacterium]|nr:hypothetical protein [Solirubrobacteraceae bacterium]
EPDGHVGHGTIRLRTAAAPEVVEAVLDAAPEIKAEVIAEPEPEPEPAPAAAPEPDAPGHHGHGTIRLRSAAPAAPPAEAPPADAPPAPSAAPTGEIQRLEAEAKAASQAAYEAYNPGHGKRPAPNAGELLAKAAQAAAALAAAKGA